MFYFHSTSYLVSNLPFLFLLFLILLIIFLLLRPEDLWVRGERRSLLEARLFPVLHPRGGVVGLEGGVAWLLGGAGCLRRWREAWRLSLREVLSLTHQEAELQWREELLFLAGRRRVRDALRSRTDACLLPCFRAAVLGGQQGALLEALDSREWTSGVNRRRSRSLN